MDSYGFWSVIPPLLAIGLAYATRQVIPALAISIWTGATILSGGNPVAGFGLMFRDNIAGAAADPWNVTILSVCMMLGGMIGIIAGAGGMRAVAERLAGQARTPRGGQLMTALLGLAVFFDDYANTLLVGSAMRPVTDRLRVSREKLSFLCDATAAPVASLSLISTWATYEMGILRGVFDSIGLDMNSYEALIRSLPYRFYSVFMLVFVFAVSILGRDFGPMRRAEGRARTTGQVLADNATPLSGNDLHDSAQTSGSSHWLAAALPLATVAVVMIAGLVITGRASLIESGEGAARSFRTVQDIIGNADGALSMLWAASCGALVAGLCALSYRTLTLSGVVESWLNGAKSVLVAVLVLVLAWGIGQVCRDLGTATFLAGGMAGWLHPGFMPLASFLLGCLIAFATGTAYGTVAILMPLAVPLAFTLSGSSAGPLMFATIGAIFTGAVFGDHCSPISDTTIMSSMACAADHIDHVRTQLPYALTVAAIALACGFVPAGFGLHPALSIIAGGALVVLVVRFAGKPSA